MVTKKIEKKIGSLESWNGTWKKNLTPWAVVSWANSEKLSTTPVWEHLCENPIVIYHRAPNVLPDWDLNVKYD